MKKIRKAVVAFFTTAFGAAITAVVTNGMPADQAGWVALIGAAVGVGLAAAIAVYTVPNAPAVTLPASGRQAAVRRDDY